MIEKKSEKPEPSTKRKQHVVCEDCGRVIPKARLKILPNATLCVQCMSARESSGEISPVMFFDEYDASEMLDTITPDD